MSLVSRERVALVVIDLQERLLAGIPRGASIVEQSVRLIRAAKELAVPVLWTEQYPKGLGPTVPPVATELDHAAVEKLSFGCLGEPKFAEAVESAGRKQLLLTGAETHVCVLQTALSALERGYEVFVVTDAVASRVDGQHEAGLARMAASGVQAVTAEMAVFEMLGCAGTPEFKRLLPLIKELTTPA